MYIVLPKKQKKDKLFVNKKTVPLKSELVKIEKIKAENKKVDIYYHYDVYVEIDKRVAIEKNIQNISVEISNNSLSKLNNRETLLEGIDTKNPKEINLLATNANTFRINSTLNNKQKFNIKKIGKISSDDVFDSRTASKIKNFNLPDNAVFKKTKKRYVLKQKNTSIFDQKKAKKRSNFNFLGLHQNQSKKENAFSNPRRVFKKKYNKFLKVGKNPSDLINLNIGNKKQSSFNFLKGRHAKLTKRSRHSFNDGFIKTINDISSKKTFEQIGNISSEKFELVLEESNNRNALLKQRIKIHENSFIKLKKSNLRLLFIAKNDKNVSIDVTEGILKHTEEKKKLFFPNFNYSVDTAQNYRGDIRLQIQNNDAYERRYNVYALKKNNYLEYSQQEYVLEKKSIRVKPGKKRILFKNYAKFNNRTSVFFRVNIVHEGIEYANSKFVSFVTKNTPSNTFTGGIAVKNSESSDRHIIEVKNIPVETKRLQVIRRNISKKQRTFSLIKKIEQNSNGQLLDDNGKVLKENNDIDLFVFFDDDVEINNVYEYKIRIYDENNFKKESANSFIAQYVKKTGFLNVNTSVVTDQESSLISQYLIKGEIEKKETDADRVFNDLFGRFYDLFENDLKEIKDLNSLSYNLLIEVYNKDTGEVALIDKVSVDKDGFFEKKITLENAYSYFVKIIPRVIPPAQIIAKINNSMPLLAKKSRFLPVSAFNTAAIKRVSRNTNAKIISSTGIKYSDRANRNKGKIVDRKTFLQEGNFDLYFDGETGDNIFLDINSTTKEIKKTPSLASGKIELIKKEKSNLRIANDQNYETGEEKYLSTFIIDGLGNNLDFLIMSYSENGNINVDGMAYSYAKNTNKSVYNYVYSLTNAYGKIIFYAQPVMKNGNILEKIKISTILKDDLGIK